MERLLDYFIPEKYFLALHIDKYAGTIGGDVTVTGIAKQKTIKFHAVDLSIDAVEVDGESVEFSLKKDLLEVHLSIISQNPIKVKISYHGTLNKNMEGAYLSTYEHDGKEEIIVATQFESHYAREAFPCIDEPAAKAIFELKITVPGDDLVLSNMPTGRGDRDRRCHVFQPTPRMSTYLLAWVIGNFHGKTIKNSHGVEITTYCALNQDLDSVDFANEIAAKSLDFYDDNFGIKFPLAKLDQVALPDFEAGAMENWGLVTYRESMLLAGKTAPLGTKKSVALTVAHELSHQWFGNLVTMQWWDDLWLNESFATAMEYYAVDHIHPEYQIFEGFFTRDCYAALTRDAMSGVQSVHQDVKSPAEIATLFDSAIVYAKGAHLMFMLIRLMGWDNFLKGIKDYFKKYQYQNTIGDNLWDALNTYADFDIKTLMHSFIDRPGYPVVSLNDQGFTQKRFLLDAPLESSDWPLPEITEDMSGHYIINLSEDQFSQRLEHFDKLTLEEKLRLLIDHSLLTKTDLRNPASTIPLIQKFQHESSAAVWNIIASLIASLKIFVDDESKEEAALKVLVKNLIAPKLKEVGLTTNQNDDENTIRLRNNLLALAYFAEDKPTLEKLAAEYSDDYASLEPETRDAILSAKIFCDPSMTDVYLSAYQTTANPDIKDELLGAACLVKSQQEIKKPLALLGNLKIVKPQDQLYLFVDLYRNPKSRTETFDWLTKNWDKIKQSGGDKSISDYPMLLGRLIRTDEEQQKFQTFFTPLKNDSALTRAITVAENEIKARLDLIKKYRDAVYASLGVTS
ncbi:M1 family metallopeptidase [Candidatus Saccharibacteria bacterium]|nr:M1 family metallopeptidase [Candidatus Saccharibacteria bacterium]